DGRFGSFQVAREGVWAEGGGADEEADALRAVARYFGAGGSADTRLAGAQDFSDTLCVVDGEGVVGGDAAVVFRERSGLAGLHERIVDGLAHRAEALEDRSQPELVLRVALGFRPPSSSARLEDDRHRFAAGLDAEGGVDHAAVRVKHLEERGRFALDGG